MRTEGDFLQVYIGWENFVLLLLSLLSISTHLRNGQLCFGVSVSPETMSGRKIIHFHAFSLLPSIHLSVQPTLWITHCVLTTVLTSNQERKNLAFVLCTLKKAENLILKRIPEFLSMNQDLFFRVVTLENYEKCIPECPWLKTFLYVSLEIAPRASEWHKNN